MGRHFRIHSSINLNLLFFFILFHFQISKDFFTINKFHMVVLINYRNNLLASNNRLIIATFNNIERHNPSCYINRRLCTRIVVSTSDCKHNVIRALSIFFNQPCNSHRITIFFKPVTAREIRKLKIRAMFYLENNRLDRIAGSQRLRFIFNDIYLRLYRLMNHINVCKSGIIVIFTNCNNSYRV